MIQTPIIVDQVPRLAAMVHLKVLRRQIKSVMGPALQEVYDAINAQSLKPVGPWFTYQHSAKPEEHNLEVCVPVPSRIESTGRVTCGSFPQTRVVRTVHRGPYDGPSGLAGAWRDFHDWIKANGLTIASDFYESYIMGPESGPDPEQWLTELSCPLVE